MCGLTPPSATSASRPTTWRTGRWAESTLSAQVSRDGQTCAPLCWLPYLLPLVWRCLPLYTAFPMPPVPSSFCQRQQDDNGAVPRTLSVKCPHDPCSCRRGGRTLRMWSWCSSWARTTSPSTLSSSLPACWGQVSHFIRCLPGTHMPAAAEPEGFMQGLHLCRTSPSSPREG